MDIKAELTALADADYRRFSAKLLPPGTNLIGVRLPQMRALAKRIAAEDWRGWLAAAGDDTFEEVMLQGMVIGTAKADIDELLRYTAAFVPKIDNWSVCDSFCASLRFVRRQPEAVWEFLSPYLSSGREFDVRFAVVAMLDHFVDEAHVDGVIARLTALTHEGYYVRMAAAWTLSVCFVRFPEKVYPLLEAGVLDPVTHNLTIRKIRESLRVSREDKAAVARLKRPAPPVEKPF